MDGAVAGPAPYLRRSTGGALRMDMAAEPSKRRNLRTALVLLTVAGVFFLGIMVKVALFGL